MFNKLGLEVALNLAGIVLCGGKSRRMGLTKHRLPFGDRSMLCRTLDTLAVATGSKHSLIVVAAADQELDLPMSVMVVHDQQTDGGPLEGIAVGLAAAQSISESAFVTSCDAPLLKSEFITRLSQLLEGYEAAVIDDGRFRHPLGAVYDTKLAGHARDLLEGGTRSVQVLLDRCRTRSVTPRQVADVDPELLSLRNVNSPADYFEAARLAGVTIPEEVRLRLKSN